MFATDFCLLLTAFDKVLSVGRDASKEDIRKAYRKAALSSHPDKVPEAERETAEIKFKAVQQAYDILYDEDKRHLYDTHGMSAFDGSGNPGMGGGPDLDDILAQMFGGMGGMGGMGDMPGFGPGGRSNKPRKSPNEETKYEVTLEDLYKGKTVKFASTKNVICGLCNGRGGKEKATPKECSACEGRGQKTVLTRLGPMLTQSTAPCTVCEGQGNFFSPKDKCKKCKGKKVTEEKKMLEIYIPRGAKEGDKVTLEGEADQVPDQEPGDIIFHLEEVEHPVFRRAGPDLTADLQITLAEALAGFSRVVVKHLDGRGIEITHPKTPGDILSPGQVLKVPGEGMPHKKSDAHGDLYLVVDVKFPDETWTPSPAVLEKLKEILPKPEPPIEAETIDEVDYEADADIEEFGQGDPRGGSGWEDEDEEGETAQCATQ
ncbi:DnaJ protein homolog xdj1 [Talaromyces islandicus]|uniref:DnaJ protein homolog xdj1 n=1 Tax=Talaromyces islandicus TaxID=28573 RepID=A0A0U1LLN5_TALIS|nr:DnaJ protein homolog xdj1 [Talaromyces islandicus]